jgi:hypothetical protein
MVRILGVSQPAFLNLPSISTHSAKWGAPSYPYMSHPRFQRQKSLTALEMSFSPAKTIDALRQHRWSGNTLDN